MWIGGSVTILPGVTIGVFKAILALPVPVAIIIPSLLLYFSGWQPSDFVLWRFLIGIVCFLGGLLLAVSTVRLFPKLGNGTPAPWDPTSKMIISGPYAYVRNPMITGVVLILAGEAMMLSSWAIGNLCCQFPIAADYDGVGMKGSKFTFYL